MGAFSRYRDEQRMLQWLVGNATPQPLLPVTLPSTMATLRVLARRSSVPSQGLRRGHPSRSLRPQAAQLLQMLT